MFTELDILSRDFLYYALTFIIRGLEMKDVLTCLLIFALILAVAGTIIALSWYFGVELPIQHTALQTPTNMVIPKMPI